LGTSKTITYPAIVDEQVTKVTVNQNDGKIPHSSQIIKDQSYKFSPPLTAFADVGTHTLKVKIEDVAKK
jgi:hypothetical protein